MATNNNIELSVEQIVSIREEACAAAKKAASEYFDKELGGVDRFACGFAWTIITEFNGKKIDGRSKIGKALTKAGIDKNWNRQFEIWNPSGFPAQNVDTLLAGATAAAEVFVKHGFKAYGCSRLD